MGPVAGGIYLPVVNVTATGSRGTPSWLQKLSNPSELSMNW